MKPLISVLTPTWNRAGYLTKVWEHLAAQTFKDFEWIVANDGPSDNTVDVVRELAAKSDFPVTLINASCRVGKSRMDNELVNCASGEFILWCDSDDYLLPNALEVLVNTWQSIPHDDREEFCGVSALCDTESGVLGIKFYRSQDPVDLSWNELHYKLKSDHVIFIRAELVKAYPFLEVDFLIPESSVWIKIGTRKTRFLPVALKRVSYREANCLSYSGNMSFNRGNAYAMALNREYVSSLLDKTTYLRRAINYLRYCKHGEIPFVKALRLWQAKWADVLLFSVVLPISELLALKDTLQGKVRKTHREFLLAQAKVKIETERLNFDV